MLWGFGVGIDGGIGMLPFTSRFRLCVKRVAGPGWTSAPVGRGTFSEGFGDPYRGIRSSRRAWVDLPERLLGWQASQVRE